MRPLVLLVLVLLTACRESPTEPKFEGTATLGGRVTYVETGAPAAGARVRASASPPGTTNVETVVDASGSYRFTNLIGGSYAVSVFLPDSNDLAYLRLIDIGGNALTLDFEISANRCVTITGIVTDRITRRGIEGAVVSHIGQVATTDAQGFYKLELGCPPPRDGMNHLWSIRHPQYQPREFNTPVPTYSTRRDAVLDPL
jgi:hypothetical protein